MNVPPFGRQVRDVCLIGQGEACCRYLLGDGAGFHCAKHQPDVAWIIAERQAAGTMIAKGDNCDGFPIGKVLT